MGADIVPRQKADATNYDQKHNYEVDQWVGDVSAQRYKRLAGSSQKVKTGIAKCRYRVKGCHPDAFDAIIMEENRKHGSHAEQFNKQCTLYAEFGQADNTADFRCRNCILHRTALHERNFPSR